MTEQQMNTVPPEALVTVPDLQLHLSADRLQLLRDVADGRVVWWPGRDDLPARSIQRLPAGAEAFATTRIDRMQRAGWVQRRRRWWRRWQRWELTRLGRRVLAHAGRTGGHW